MMVNKPVRFECNGCGGCCHGGISLTLEEYLTYNYNDFPVQLCFSVYDSRNLVEPEFPKSRLKEQKKFLSKNILFYSKSEDGRKIAVIPEIVTLVPQDEPCPNLDNQNHCKIYYRKPSVCGIYPYRIDKEFGSMHYGLMHEKSRSLEGDGIIPCEGFKDSSPIYFNGTPCDPEVYERIRQRAKHSSSFKSKFKEFFNHKVKDELFMSDVSDNSHFNSPTGKRIRVSIAEFLEWCDINEYGILTTPTRSAIKNNMNQLEKQFDVLIDKKEGRYKQFCAEMKIEAINHMRIINKEP